MSNSPNQPSSRDNRNDRLDDASHTNPFGEQPIADAEDDHAQAGRAAHSLGATSDAPRSTSKQSLFTPRKELKEDDAFSGYVEQEEPPHSDDATETNGAGTDNASATTSNGGTDAPADTYTETSASAHSEAHADTYTAEHIASGDETGHSDSLRVPGRHRLDLPDTNPAYYPADEPSAESYIDSRPRDDQYSASHRLSNEQSNAAEKNPTHPENAPTTIHDNHGVSNSYAATPFAKQPGAGDSTAPNSSEVTEAPASEASDIAGVTGTAAAASAVPAAVATTPNTATAAADSHFPAASAVQQPPAPDSHTPEHENDPADEGKPSHSLIRRIFNTPVLVLLFILLSLGLAGFLGVMLMADQEPYKAYESDLKVLSSTSPAPPGAAPAGASESATADPSARPGKTIKGAEGASLTLEGQRVRICDIGKGDFTRAAAPAGLACPFVESVREEYNDAASDKRNKLTVTSPVSGREFTLQCKKLNDDLVRCRGNGTTMTVYLGN